MKGRYLVICGAMSALGKICVSTSPQWQLTLLTPTAEARALHFDLLLARPQQRSLLGSYDRALSILEQVPHTELWEGEAIARYSQRTAHYLLG